MGKKALRWVVSLLGMAIAALVLFAVVVRFGDGPVGAFQGGPLVGGEMVHAPVDDWSFAAGVELPAPGQMSRTSARA